MNKLRKALVVILSALFLLCASLFAACTTGSGKTQAQKPDDAVTPGQSEQEPEEKPGDPQEETCDIHVEVNDEALGAYRLSGERAVNGGFKVGTPVTVTVEPAAGYDATLKVNGEEVPLDGGSYTFTAQADTTLSVDYNYKYRISTTVLAGEGTITPAAPADGEKYAEGEDVKVEVAPAAGYVVEYVKINGVVTEPDEDGKYTVKMTGRMYVVAEFIAVHTITVENNGNGTVTLNDAAYEAPIENVKDGTVYTLKVTPADGEEIKAVYVNGALTPLDAEGKATITVKADTLIKVVYVGRYTVSLPENENVVVNIAEGKAASYAEGTVLHITVSAVEGYRLTSVTVKVGETPVEALGGVYTVTMSANVTVEADVEALAEVEKHTVTLLYNNGSLGSAELTGAEAVEGQYAYGSKLTLTVTPNEGNKVDKVEVNGKKVALEEGKYTFTVKEDTTIYIVFKTLPRYIVTVDDRTGADATIAVSEPFDNKGYYEGETLTITATEIAHHCLVFVAVDGDEPVDITADENGNYVWKHTVTADVKITVTVLHSYSVEINNDPLKGTVERLLDDGSTEAVESWYQENEEVTLIITPLEGYRISKVTVVSGGESFVDEFDYITASYNVARLDENTVVTVEYVAIYEISVNVAGIDGVENASVVLTVVNTESGEQVKELGTLTESGEKTYTLDEGTSLKADYTAPVTHRIGLDPQIPGVSFGGMVYVEPDADKEGTFDFSLTYNGGSVSVTYELYTHTVTVDGQLQEAPVTNSESYKLPAQPDPQYGLNGLNQHYTYKFTWVVNGDEYEAGATVENVRKDLVVTSKWSAQLPFEKTVSEDLPEGAEIEWGILEEGATLTEGTPFDITITVPQGYRAIVKFYTHTKNVITGSEGKVTTAMGVYQAKTEDITEHFKDTVREGLKLEIEITFEQIFTVTVTENANVDVEILSRGDYNNDYFIVGNTFEFKVTAHEGYRVSAVKANGTVIVAGEDGKYSHTLDGPTTITIETVATAKLNLITPQMPEGVQGWTLTTADGTSLTEVTTLDIGSKINVIVNLKPGYYFYGTEISGTNMAVYPGVKAYGNISLNNAIVNGDVTINIVVVARDHFTVTETHDEGATVTLSAPTTQVPDMSGKYYYNEKVTVTVNVDDQHVLASVKVNEGVVSLNGDGTYTLTVTDNVTITVSVLPKLTVDFPESKPGEPSTSNGAPEQGEWKAMDGADNVIEIGANTMTINGEAVTKIESNNKTGGEVVYTLTTKDGDYTMEWFGQAEGYILQLTDPAAAVSVSRRAVRTIAAGGVSYYVNPKYSTEYFDDFVEGDSEKLVNIDWTADESHLSVTNVDGKIHISLGEDAATYVFAVEAGHYLFVIGAGAYDLTISEDGSLTVNETTYSKPVENEVTRVYGAELRGVLLVLKIEVKGYTQEELNTAEIKLICGPDNTSYDKAVLNSVGDYYELHFNGIIYLGAGEHELSLKVGNQVFDNLTDSAQPSSVPNGEKTYELSVKETKLVLTVSEKTVEIEKKLEDFHGGSFNTNEETIEFFVHVYGYQDSELTAENVSLVYDTYTVDCALSGSLISNNIASNSHVIIHLQFKLETIGVHGATELKLKIGDDSYSINHSGLVGTGTKDGKVYNITHADGKLTLTVSEVQSEYTVQVKEESKIDGCSYELKNNGEDVGEKVPANATLTLTVTVPENYTATVKVDGATLENNGENSYTIKNITGDVTITITYAEKGEEVEKIVENVYNPFYESPTIIAVWFQVKGYTKQEVLDNAELWINGVKYGAKAYKSEESGVAGQYKLSFDGIMAVLQSADGDGYDNTIEFKLGGNTYSPITGLAGGPHDNGEKTYTMLAKDNKLIINVKSKTVDPDAPKNLPYNDEEHAEDGWTIFNQDKTINEATEKDGVVTVTFSGNQNGYWWGIQVYYKNKEYTSGAKITVSFTITSTVAGKIRFFDSNEGGTEKLEFTQDKLTLNFKSDAFVVNSKNTVVKLYMAVDENEARIDAATITISDLHIENVTDPEPQKTIAFSDAKLQLDGGVVYLVVKVDSTVYSTEELETMKLFDGEASVDLDTDKSNLVANGQSEAWFALNTIKNEGDSENRWFWTHIKINDLNFDGANGDLKPTGSFSSDVVSSAEVDYYLHSEGGQLVVVAKNRPAVTDPTYEATKVELAQDGDNVYLIVSGTYKNYSVDDLKVLLEGLDTNLQHVPGAAGSANLGYLVLKQVPHSVEVTEEGWTYKFTVTVGTEVVEDGEGAKPTTIVKGTYVAHIVTTTHSNGDIKVTDATDGSTVECGDYKYQLVNKYGASAEKQYWGCVGLLIYGKDEVVKQGDIDYSTIKLEEVDGKPILTIGGTHENCTEADFKFDLELSGAVVHACTVDLSQPGKFTVTVDLSDVGVASRYIMHLKIAGVGDGNVANKDTDPDGTLVSTLNIGTKTYSVVKMQLWGSCFYTLKVEDSAAPALSDWAAELVQENGSVYLKLTATARYYDNDLVKKLAFAGKDGVLVVNQSGIATLDGTTVTIMINVSDIAKKGNDYLNKWWRAYLTLDGNPIDNPNCATKTEMDLDVGGYKYELRYDNGLPYVNIKEGTPVVQETYTVEFSGGDDNGDALLPQKVTDIATGDSVDLTDKTVTKTNYAFQYWYYVQDGKEVKVEDSIIPSEFAGLDDDNEPLTLTLYPKFRFDLKIGTEDNNKGYDDGKPSYTETLNKGDVVTFSGTMTSQGKVNWNGPFVLLYSADATKVVIRADNWVVGYDGQGDSVTVDAENYVITKKAAPLFDAWQSMLVSAKLTIRFDYTAENEVIIAIWFDGANGVSNGVTYSITATADNTLKDSYTLGIGCEESYVVLNNRVEAKAHEHAYEDGRCTYCGAVQPAASVEGGETATATWDAGTFDTTKWAKEGFTKGSKVTIYGTQTKAATSDAWFSLIAEVDTLDVSKSVTLRTDNHGWYFNNASTEGGHLFEATKKFASAVRLPDGSYVSVGDWATVKQIEKQCDYKVEFEWTGDTILVSIILTGTSDEVKGYTYVQQYSVDVTGFSTVNIRFGAEQASGTVDRVVANYVG